MQDGGEVSLISNFRGQECPADQTIRSQHKSKTSGLNTSNLAQLLTRSPQLQTYLKDENSLEEFMSGHRGASNAVARNQSKEAYINNLMVQFNTIGYDSQNGVKRK